MYLCDVKKERKKKERKKVTQYQTVCEPFLKCHGLYMNKTITGGSQIKKDLSRQAYFRRDKLHVFCRDKDMLGDKHVFVATKMFCHDKHNSVAGRKFCRGKHTVVAPANDMKQQWVSVYYTVTAECESSHRGGGGPPARGVSARGGGQRSQRGRVLQARAPRAGQRLPL